MRTNDAIVSELLEMNGGAGFDTKDLFDAMNEARADERERIIGMQTIIYDLDGIGHKAVLVKDIRAMKTVDEEAREKWQKLLEEQKN